MIYKASLDKLAKWTTLVIFIVLISISLKSITFLFINTISKEEEIIHLGLISLFFLILLFSWLFAPIHYLIESNTLIIHRKIGNVSIDLKSVLKIKLLTSNEIKGTIRTFGVGGLFGYYGKFYVPKIGSCTVYASQRNNMILIELDNQKKLIITPDEIKLADLLLSSCENCKSIH